MASNSQECMMSSSRDYYDLPTEVDVHETETIRFDPERGQVVIEGSLVRYRAQTLGTGDGGFGFGKGG